MTTGDLVAERLLTIIDEGRRTATYKLALLAATVHTDDLVAVDTTALQAV